MRLSRFGILGALAIAAVGCSSSDSGPTTPTIPSLAYIRYINAVPDTLNTTVRFIDGVEFTPTTFVNVPFRGLGQGNYQGIGVGARKMRVFTADFVNFSEAGNTAILVDTTLTFEAGKYYTLLHVGYARAGSSPKQGIVVYNDVLPSPTTGIAVRALHAGSGIGNVDLYVTAAATTPIAGAPAVASLAFKAASNYLNLAVGAFAAQVTATGSTTAVAAALAPAGLAAVTASGTTPAADPTAGSTQAGSVMTAIAFPATVAGSRAASFTTPGVVFFSDKQPPRTTP